MIKLYNHSSIPDELLLPLLNYAKKQTKAKGDVIVKVTKGGYYSHSHAKRATWVMKWVLSKRHRTKSSGGHMLVKGKVRTNGGYIILSPTINRDPLAMAENFFETAIHEFVHIFDFQQGNRFGEYNKNWKNRPHEIRACWHTDKIVEKPLPSDIQEAILNIAVYFEGKK